MKPEIPLIDLFKDMKPKQLCGATPQLDTLGR